MTEVKNLLQTNFPQIDRVFFEVENGATYLRVVTQPSSLAALTELTKNILTLLEANNVDREFVLDVYATPPSRIVTWASLGDHINAKLEINLERPLKGQKVYLGVLLSFIENELVLRYNAKGQMRKITLARADITSIETAIIQ